MMARAWGGVCAPLPLGLSAAGSASTLVLCPHGARHSRTPGDRATMLPGRDREAGIVVRAWGRVRALLLLGPSAACAASTPVLRPRRARHSRTSGDRATMPPGRDRAPVCDRIGQYPVVALSHNVGVTCHAGVRGRMAAALFAAVVLCSPVRAADVRVAVFGLFHPRRVETVRLHGNEFLLRVPGRIERRFRGQLEIVHADGEVIPVVTMDVETAVASIVAAESPPGSGIESLKAQAAVARSYLLAAGPRHPYSDFCDTTHCQFLREPPPADSLAAQAARATGGMVLVHQGRVIEALYSADCGGTTRELTSGPYPYFSVSCPVRSGSVSGHRLGLCQVGAAAMARDGATWIDILNHYFPAATLAVRH